MLRQALIFLRREYFQDVKRLLTYAGGVLLACLIVGVLLDIFLPFQRWWNMLRCLVLIPETAAIFSLLYAVALYLNRKRSVEDEDWVPLRLRFSVRVRRQMAAVAGALIFVFIYATSYGPGYTFMSSLLLSCVISLFAFIRPTREEFAREEYGLPDARDVKYQREKIARSREREVVDEEKREKRRSRLRKVLKGEE